MSIPRSPKTTVLSAGAFIVLLSIACGLPANLGSIVNQAREREGQDQAAQAVEVAQQATGTPVPPPTQTPLPTDTPIPTPTATLVVQPTATNTAVPGSGAQGAAAPPGGEGAQPATGGGGEEATPAPGGQPVAGPENVIVNGDFEADWPDWQTVATGWQPFDNGSAHFGWFKDTWDKVVFDGEQAQLIEIINDQGQGDRYAGIFQTVEVVAGAEYELTLHGLVRSDEGSAEASNWGYRLQYGLDFNGGSDWTQVTEWIELPFDDHPRTDPNASNVYNYGAFTARIVPTGQKLTLFIRAWQKFPTGFEGNYDVDAVSLVGTGQTQATATPTREATPAPTDTPAAQPSPTMTPTPEPSMPDSGGALPLEAPSPVVVGLGGLLVLTLVVGAVAGLVRRRA
ncbi:MAG: hypothetical protein ACE5H9_04810 [Anaerolineae bacterium]